jgi:hypothetical protein
MLALIGLTTTANSEGWLCESQSASGFRFDSKLAAWIPTDYTPTSRLIVQRTPDLDLVVRLTKPNGIAYVLKSGSSDGRAMYAICARDLMFGGEHIFCDNVMDKLGDKIDSPKLHIKLDEPRFTFTSLGDYFVSMAELRTKDRPNPMYTEIGRCTAL